MMIFSIYFYTVKYKPLQNKINQIEQEKNALLVRMASIDREYIEQNDSLTIPSTEQGQDFIDSLQYQIEKIYIESDTVNFIGASVEIPMDNIFDPDSITVWSIGGKDLLVRIANILKRSGKVQAKFEIYNDCYIPDEAQIYAIKTPWQVAAKRGVDIIQYLTDSCEIGQAILTLEILGPNYPLGDTTTEEGRQRTRRIVFSINEK